MDKIKEDDVVILLEDHISVFTKKNGIENFIKIPKDSIGVVCAIYDFNIYLVHFLDDENNSIGYFGVKEDEIKTIWSVGNIDF